ncbi:enoyl-CoA hydratase/isomerase family protein [Actinomadura madurae]|uniref:enoyl-CoA hydratase/isomerase family protein n=1 Tax=Actinomadura madurae TaxID=1993 RepID=UPI0020262AE1|nr:enoyl-CoA hydratase/isomerase family protein [Actinomadura madurae]URM93941.1 enoyl-CoA hydratase/isomerase family protein [Actinomadura madurae]
MTDAVMPNGATHPGRVTARRALEHVQHIEMHGDGRNPLDLQLLRELAESLETAAEDTDCRAVVLSSTDRHFCAGATSKFATGGSSWSTADLYREVPRLFAFPKPLVAALNGATVGGGLGLALVADWRQMATDARAQVNFSRLGYTPGFALTRTLPDVVGRHRAAELMMSGRAVPAQEALAIGLCDGVSAPQRLLDDALARARTFAEAAPQPARLLKFATRRPLLADLERILAAELAQQTALKTTEDYAEGMAAVQERRTARFLDR